MKRISIEMLRIIASEARTLDEYARRADAWRASEACKPADDVLIRAWVAEHAKRATKKQRNEVRNALRFAAERRTQMSEQLWNRLASNINNEES